MFKNTNFSDISLYLFIVGTFFLMGFVIVKAAEKHDQYLAMKSINDTVITTASGKYSYSYYTQYSSIKISDDKKCIKFVSSDNKNIESCGQFQIERYK